MYWSICISYISTSIHVHAHAPRLSVCTHCPTITLFVLRSSTHQEVLRGLQRIAGREQIHRGEGHNRQQNRAENYLSEAATGSALVSRNGGGRRKMHKWRGCVFVFEAGKWWRSRSRGLMSDTGTYGCSSTENTRHRPYTRARNYLVFFPTLGSGDFAQWKRSSTYVE